MVPRATSNLSDPFGILCFGLGFLAADVTDPKALIEGTYSRLLDRLGGKISPSTLQRMIEAKNPYAVPEQGETDLASVQRRMRELREMIDKRGWLTPETETALLDLLATRLRATVDQKATVETQVRETVRGYEMQFPSTSAMIVSPDGKHLTTLLNVGRGQRRTVAYDLKTRATVRGTKPLFNGDQFRFNADGTYLVFDRNGQIFRIAFDGGQPHWEKAEQVGNLVSAGKLMDLLPAADGVSVYTRHETTPGSRRPETWLSPFGGGSVKVGLPNVEWSSDWGLVPGHDGLWSLALDHGHGLSVSEYGVAPNGVATPRSHWRFANRNLTNAVFASDGKSVLAYGREGNSALELATVSSPTLYGPPPAVQSLELPKDSSGQSMSIFDVKVHPGANKVAVLVNDKNGGRQLAWYDLKTGKALGETPIPAKAFTRLVMDPTGNHFLLGSPEGHVYVGNLEAAPQ